MTRPPAQLSRAADGFTAALGGTGQRPGPQAGGRGRGGRNSRGPPRTAARSPTQPPRTAARRGPQRAREHPSGKGQPGSKRAGTEKKRRPAGGRPNRTEHQNRRAGTNPRAECTTEPPPARRTGKVNKSLVFFKGPPPAHNVRGAWPAGIHENTVKKTPTFVDRGDRRQRGGGGPTGSLVNRRKQLLELNLHVSINLIPFNCLDNFA